MDKARRGVPCPPHGPDSASVPQESREGGPATDEEEDGWAERLAITHLVPPQHVTRRDPVTPQPHSWACARAWGLAAHRHCTRVLMAAAADRRPAPALPHAGTGTLHPASQARREGQPFSHGACAACARRASVPAVGHSPTPDPGAGDPLRPRNGGRGPHRGVGKANGVPAAGPPWEPPASPRGRSTCHPGWNSPPAPQRPVAGDGHTMRLRSAIKTFTASVQGRTLFLQLSDTEVQVLKSDFNFCRTEVPAVRSGLDAQGWHAV